MKATIIPCVMGIFGFGEADNLLARIFFPRDSLQTAKRLDMIQSGKAVQETTTLIKQLEAKGFLTFVFEDYKIAQTIHEKLKVEVDVKTPSKAGELLRKNLEKFAVDSGFVKRRDQLYRWIHEVNMELAKIGVIKAVKKRDLLVIQVIQSINDMDKTLNLFVSRIREWYGLHFPELDRQIDNHERYIQLVAHLGRRGGFTLENLAKEGMPKEKAKRLVQMAKASIGTDLREEDIKQIEAICKSTLELYSLRQSMEEYLSTVMIEVAPNINALAGSLLGARLIALAGGLENLAKLPSSTIQVLGAEKALFRALRTGSRPPKHGIIFQHTLIHEAKRWQRGKVSRALAGKLAIAARTDAFRGVYKGEELISSLEKRIEEIMEKFRKPAISEPKPRKRPRRKKNGH